MSVGGLTLVATPQTAQTWNNMPLAQTELFGTSWARRQADLTGLVQFRITVTQSVAGTAAATLRAQYSTDAGANWNSLQAAGTGADLIVGAGTGVKTGAWGAIAALAIADVQLRLVGENGDGATDPSFRHISIQFQ